MDYVNKTLMNGRAVPRNLMLALPIVALAARLREVSAGRTRAPLHAHCHQAALLMPNSFF